MVWVVGNGEIETLKDSFHIQWHITHLCNLRCRHCYQEDFSRIYDLDWAGLKRVSENIFSTLKEWDQTACIHLTGGEPFLKPEWFSLLDYLNSDPLVDELGIITNGLLFDRNLVERLSTFSKLKKIKISLDGASAEINDSIRSKGSFDQVRKSLPLIQKTKRFEILFMFTVMKRNFKELLSFFKLSKELGVNGFIIERFIPWGRGRGRMDEVLGREDWKEVIQTLLSISSIEDENSLLSYQAFQVSLVGEEPELLGAPCVIGKDGLCILPNGDIFPCRRLPVSIGNLLEDSLKAIWEKSELLEKLRRKENLKGKCRTCGIEECRGCRSLAYALTGDYLSEDPHCGYHDNKESTESKNSLNTCQKSSFQ